MNTYRKILYPLTALLLAFVLAACAGTRTIESFEVVGPGPQYESNIVELNVGDDPAQFGGRVTFDNGTTDAVVGQLIGWTSSNEDYVTVDDNGFVTAVDNNVVLPEGATITGEYRDFSDTITVIVNSDLTE